LDSDSGTVLGIDNLSYTYNQSSNQLNAVTDSSNSLDGFLDGNQNGPDYSYDSNGNLIQDNNKGIVNIVYNHLNLPTQITFANNQNILYIYNALGVKVEKIVFDGSNTTTTNYLSGFQYSSAAQAGSSFGGLRFFPHAEGYVNVVNDKFNYVYNYTDHLGNIRLSYVEKIGASSLSIIEESNYYPFGLKHANYNAQQFDFITSNLGFNVILASTDNNDFKHKFQGREFQDELGLNVYPFKYRTYDPAIGRFWSVDPVAENYAYNGVYNFAENRVIESIDLEGKESWYTQDGHLATKAGPYTSKARQQLNLYSPSEVQQAKAKAANYKGAMVSQDKMSASDRKAHNIAVKAAIAEKEAISQSLDNHDNYGSPHTAKSVMQGAAYGAVDYLTGAALGKVFQGGKALLGLGKITEAVAETSAYSKVLSSTSEFDPVKTLYRGTTGSEVSSSSMFLTDNAEVAASYVKNGGQVMQYEISSSGLYTLEHSGQMTVGPGMHAGSNAISTEYQFIGKELVKELINIGTPYKP
jgi:RHS repeat-associated protein